MLLIISLVIYILARYSPANGMNDRLIGYDCNNGDVNVTRIDLTTVRECVRLTENDIHVTNVSVQVISKKTKVKILYYACDIIWSRIWYYCGDLHHLHPMPDHYREFRVKLTPIECRNAHLSKSISIHGVNFYDIEVGQERREQLTLAGSFGWGYCERGNYGGSSKSTVSGHVKILLTQITDQVDITKRTINIEGVAECDNDKTKYCLHPFRGFIGWDYDEVAECTPTSWNVIYQGPAQIVSYNTNFQKNEYLTITRGHSIGAIKLKEMSSACSVVTQKTEHDDLQIVVQHRDVPFYFQKYSILEKDVSIVNYMNTKFLYLEQHIGTSLDELRIELIYIMCENLKRIYDNRLSIAALDPDQFVRLEFGLGYSGVVMGEVLYILSCTPEVVHLRMTEACYQDIPVYYNNYTMFISSRNRIIRNVSEEVECSKRLAPSFKIINDWVSLTPDVGYSETPEMLDPNNIRFNWTYKRLWNFGIAGLYEEKLVKSLENIMVQGVSKVSVLSYLVRKVKNLPTNEGNYNLIDALDMNQIKEKVTGVVSGIWSILEQGGSMFSIILFIIFIITSIIKIVSLVGNGINLYKTFGFSYQLFAAISSGLVGLLLRNRQINRDNVPNNDGTVNTSSTSDRPSAPGAESESETIDIPTPHLNDAPFIRNSQESIIPRALEYRNFSRNYRTYYPHRAVSLIANEHASVVGGTSTTSGRREP